MVRAAAHAYALVCGAGVAAGALLLARFWLAPLLLGDRVLGSVVVLAGVALLVRGLGSFDEPGGAAE